MATFLILTLFTSFCCALGFNLTSFLTDVNITSTDTIRTITKKIIQLAKEQTDMALLNYPEAAPSEYPYFHMFPMPIGNLIPNHDNAITWQGKCFSNNSGIAKYTSDGMIEVTITTTGEPTSTDCYDLYSLWTLTGSTDIQVKQSGEYPLSMCQKYHIGMQLFSSYLIYSTFKIGEKSLIFPLPGDITSSEKWDLDMKGVRIMLSDTDIPTTIANIAQVSVSYMRYGRKRD